MDVESKSFSKLRCLFIGPLKSHASIGRYTAAVAAGFEVYLVNVFDLNWKFEDNPIYKTHFVETIIDPYYHSNDSRTRKTLIIEYLRNLGYVPENHNIVTQLKNTIRSIQPHFAIVHYGAISIRYARILKRTYSKFPLIDIVNVLPSALSFSPSNRYITEKKIEELNYRYWLKRLDGVIFASQEMFDFARGKFGVDERRACILPDYLPEAFHYNGDTDLTHQKNYESHDPRVIFLGAPERWGHVIDELDNEFMSMAKEHIHIFSASISDKVVSTGFGHQYPLFTDQEVFTGKFSEYIAQFDAAIMTYNVPQREERFRSTLPTRFVSALTAGIPIAVKGGFFDACERFVEVNEVGFVYTDASDLRNKLMDVVELSKYRFNANTKRKNMTAESQGEELRKFVLRVCKFE
jgi:hypothetical protein